jgi:two-component system KDP operon response regulator KdpE
VTQPSGACILVVDDEPAILRTARTNLTRHDFRVETASTGREALDAYDRVHPDVILLDLGLPDIDGLDIIRAIRERASTPIVVLSARVAEQEKVAALELGADDYLTKPFGVNELLVRIRVALRHAARPTSGTEPVIRIGQLELDLERRRLTADSTEVHLTPTEWELMKLFFSNADKVLTDHAIMRAVWGSTYPAQAHSLQVYVARLRSKLEANAGMLRHIVTEPGVGYRFVSEGIEPTAVARRQ